MGASKAYNIHANHDINNTAINHKAFSNVVVLLELTIINIGSTQKKNIMPTTDKIPRTILTML